MIPILLKTRHKGRKAFVLYLVCAMALALSILVVSLNFFKRGAVTQLSKTIEQERMTTLAQAGVNEMLAEVKSQVNDRKSGIGKALYQLWATNTPVSSAMVLKKLSFSASDLGETQRLIRENLGHSGEISGEASIVITQSIGQGRQSFLGYVHFVATIKAQGIQERIRVKERRELKVVDLSDPFLDKYALFVKSFCESLNDPKKRLVVQGIKDPEKYSFVYLGNRSYPKCAEFPNGSKSSPTPPVILDLDFKEDRKLLGGFPNPGPFDAKDSKLRQASADNLFWRSSPIPVKNFVGNFSIQEGFHKIREFRDLYQEFIKVLQSQDQPEGSIGFLVLNDYNNKANGGKTPENTEIFRSMINSLLKEIQYHYGYSDFLRVFPDSNQFTKEYPFTGILDYFQSVLDPNSPTCNPSRLRGGKMPMMFGENRDTCTFVEGPVQLRFFKVAFIDECSFNLEGFQSLKYSMAFPYMKMGFEPQPQTFVGRNRPPLDKFTDNLMSHPIHWPINALFFDSQQVLPTTVNKSKVEGYDIFPKFEPSLKTVSHFYLTAKDFLDDRVKNIGGKEILDLDGITLILGIDGRALDLSGVRNFQGKGTIMIFRGNCQLGELLPAPGSESYLKVNLMCGRFFVPSNSGETNIQASLVATTLFPDNSQPDPKSEGGLYLGGGNVTVAGNLVVDNLLELSDLKEQNRLKIVHDPGLYFPDYPVRVSLGKVKSAFAVDFETGGSS